MLDCKKTCIGLTICFCLAAIGLVVGAFVTEHWISAFVRKDNSLNTNSSNSDGTLKFTGNITFGLFAGKRKVNYGVGVREQTITVVCDGSVGYCLIYNDTGTSTGDIENKLDKLHSAVTAYNTYNGSAKVQHEVYEFGLFPFSLWVSTIVLASLGMAFGMVNIGFSIFNIVGKPIETITGPIGLYLWNGLALLFSLLGMIMYLLLYIQYFKNNVLPLDDRLASFKTDSADLDYSFYLLVTATGLYLINIILLVVSGVRLSCGFTKEADKVMDHGIILY